MFSRRDQILPIGELYNDVTEYKILSVSMALVITMFVVNFDGLAQASDFRIERRQVVFLFWLQDSNPGVSGIESPADWMPADKATELKTWTRQPVHMVSEHSKKINASIALGVLNNEWKLDPSFNLHTSFDFCEHHAFLLVPASRYLVLLANYTRTVCFLVAW